VEDIIEEIVVRKQLTYFIALLLGIVAADNICLAQSELSSGDESVNAIQILLNLSDKSKLPNCSGVVSYRGLRFCPLIAKCTAEKPFCVSKTEFRTKTRQVRSCVCSSSIDPVEIQYSSIGTVKGKITLTNTCGGAVYVGQDCTSPYSGQYSILSGEKVVETGTTNADGFFTETLAPGKYTLAIPTLLPDGKTSIVFTVLKGQTVNIELIVDSGMRNPAPQ
jgi:hypothetical protein